MHNTHNVSLCYIIIIIHVGKLWEKSKHMHNMTTASVKYKLQYTFSDTSWSRITKTKNLKLKFWTNLHKISVLVSSVWEQGWCSGESTRLPPMWPGFKSRRQRHMWVLSLLLVLSLAPRGFSPGTPAFPCPSQKPTFSNSNSTRNRIDKEVTLRMCYL